MASTYLTRTQTAGNRRTWTWSAWIKRGDVGTRQNILSAGIDGNDESHFRFDATGYLRFKESTGNSAEFLLDTSALFRDPAAWYHIVLAFDSTQSTSTDRIKIYINGSQITSFSSASYPSLNYETRWNNNSQATYLGLNVPAHTDYFDGYMSEVHFIDGTAYAASTFGQTDTTGVWVPIVAPSVTYGTNGYYLKFANSGTMGTDSSGNSNNLSVGNGNVMQVGDTPTNNFPTFNPLGTDAGLGLGSANLRAFASTSQSYPHIMSNFAVKSGKWYLETLRSANSVTGGMGVFFTETDSSGNPTEKYMYYTTGNKDTNGSQSAYGASWGQGDLISTTYDATNGQVSFYKNGVSQGVAFTLDTSKYWQFGIQSYTTSTQEDIINFGQEGTFIGNKTAGGNSDANGYGNFFYTVPSGFLALCTQNMSTEQTINVNNGRDNFTPLIWSGDNTTRSLTGVGFQPDWVWIKSRSDSAGHAAFDNVRGPSIRNVPSSTAADTTTNEYGFVTAFGSDGFTLTPGNQGNYASGDTNMTGRTYVGWNWKAGGAAPSNTYAVKVVSDSGNKYRFDDYGTSAITLELQEGGTFTFDQSDSSNAGHPLRFSSTADGTHGGGSEYTTGVTTTGTPGQAGAKTVITVAGSAPTLYYYCTQHSGMGGQANTGSTHGFTNVKGATQTVVSPNDTAGFSIIKFTGTGGDTTIGHGLSSAPKMVILKNRADALEWAVYHRSIGAAKRLLLDTTDSVSTSSSFWQNTNPSSTVITLGSSGNSNGSSDSMIAYCFAEIEGYSRFHSYVGNGNADGPFVYTGFRPAWVMIKRTDSADNWTVIDTTRKIFNLNDTRIHPNLNDAEYSGDGNGWDMLSNGFKLRTSTAGFNASGSEFIYMAFAENPSVTSTGKPATAR